MSQTKTCNIKAIIFDLDGTLLDSLLIWDNIAANFLKRQGVIYPENIQEIITPMSYSEAAAYFINDLGVKLSPPEIFSTINQMVEDQYKYYLQLKPFAMEFLEKAKAKNYQMTIATSSDHELTRQALKRLLILDYFQFILTCEDIGKSKSSPEIYLSSAESLGYKPREIIVFEDALHCVKTVKQAGFQTAAIFDPHWQEDIEDIKKHTDYFFQSFKEAINIL